MRIALSVAYDGSAYHGWQLQGALPTVQQAIEQALTQVAAHPVTVTASGRTDRGVHALGQVLHFDTTANRSERGWVLGSNKALTPDIRVLWAKPVSAHFHARFSATARHYRYAVHQQSILLPWFRRYALCCWKPLNIVQMQRAAQYLLGEHDFSAFRAASCQSKSAVRQVTRLTVTRDLPWVWIDIGANAFLHHMVRNIVGVLIEVGEGKRPAATISTLLANRDRKQAAATAQARGLYLRQVDYPPEFELPSVQAASLLLGLPSVF